MKKTVLAILFLLSSSLLWANGDPVATFSAMTLSRTPVAVHVPEVQLMQESLEITPMGTYTHVHVTYLLRNTSNKHFRNLHYGFPIDYIGSGPARWGEDNPFTESEREIGWRDSYIRNVAFTLNNNMLPWQCSADTMLSAPKPILTKEEEKADTTGELWENRVSQLFFSENADATTYRQLIYGIYRRWFYTALNIAPNQAVTLEVDYQVYNSTATDLYRLGSEFCQQWPAGYDFHYDFSPASYWGNGKAETFEVNLHTDHVIKNKKDKETWREFDAKQCIRGLDMKKVNENLYTFFSRNFDLAKAEPLQIEFFCPTNLNHQPVADILSHRIPPSQYTVKVSGSDSKYPAANLSDLDLTTATVLKPDPRGENYITITFKDSMRVTGIVFYNGYCKDLNSYINNSRAQTMLVSTKDRKDEYGHDPKDIHYPFAHYSYDNRQDTYTPDTLPTAIPSTFTWQGLTDQALVIPMANRPVQSEDGSMATLGYPQYLAVKQITFAIPATIPGKKYDDLCISEIIVLGGKKSSEKNYYYYY